MSLPLRIRNSLLEYRHIREHFNPTYYWKKTISAKCITPDFRIFFNSTPFFGLWQVLNAWHRAAFIVGSNEVGLRLLFIVDCMKHLLWTFFEVSLSMSPPYKTTRKRVPVSGISACWHFKKADNISEEQRWCRVALTKCMKKENAFSWCLIFQIIQWFCFTVWRTKMLSRCANAVRRRLWWVGAVFGDV